MISALRPTASQTETRTAALMPPGPWLYPEDQIADMPVRCRRRDHARKFLSACTMSSLFFDG
jgi:hypothetical protein